MPKILSAIIQEWKHDAFQVSQNWLVNWSQFWSFESRKDCKSTSGNWEIDLRKKRKGFCPDHNWSYQFSSVAQLCLTLCDPVDCSMPGFPVHYQLPEPTQTHVYWVGDAIQPPHPLSLPFFSKGTLSVPFWYLCQKLSLFYTLIKLYYTKSTEQSSLITGPRSNSSPLEAKNPGIVHNSHQQLFSSLYHQGLQ